ncbi:MAG: tRNA lysidine(34) synthetase TilS, partial [Muribaculaceae bacterium]|nr:tRNA lysidine(34) synthetase TilS [Muribaculaceae bacterium]
AEGYTCVAAHCNFHLRGEESRRDMLFVQSLTEQLGVDLYVRDFDVPKAMAATGESMEMTCRRLRYEWFDELLTMLKLTDVAVGHHREDNVETFFLNLIRGSGIAGLTGMSYRRGQVVRPLLDCTRGQIERYLTSQGLDYVTDSTNLELDCKRNCLRNSVLLELERLLPGALEGVERSMRMLGDARSVFEGAVRQAAMRYGDGASGSINVGALALEQDARILLFHLLYPQGFGMTQVEAILADTQRSGAVFYSKDGWRAELSRGMLEITPVEDADTLEWPVSLERDISEPAHISVFHHDDCASFSPEVSASVAYLDRSALRSGPWVLRHWRKGDRIRPFGMKGSRLVSDVFSDAKMTARQKREAWLLTCGEQVVWIVGVRTSAHFAVTRRSGGYIELRLLPT